MKTPKSALIVIDVQNDYFAGGKLPLWKAEETLERVEAALAAAREKGIPVVLVQHQSGANGSFFVPGSEGVAIHPAVRAAAPGAPVVVKAYADSFHETTLAATLEALGAEELLICGMMTQNCVAHTALSRGAEPYPVTVLVDACTTLDERVHRFALSALSTRVSMKPVEQVFA